MQTYDVITIGGATLDIFLTIHESNEHCCVKTDETGAWFCLKRGEKIPVDTLNFAIGGNAANIAVGLSRFGVSCAASVHFGSDEISRKIFNTLKNEGVSTEFMVEDKAEASAIGIAINFQGERTLFVHHIVRNHALPAISIPKWLYLTSVGERWEDLYRQVIDFVKTNSVSLAFTPGSHQFDSGVSSFLEQVKAATLLLVNKEEGKLIAGTASNDVKTILTQLKALGPSIVSLTDGSNGAYAIDWEGKTYAIAAFSQTPLERTGAGDGYASGFLGAIVLGHDVEEAMRWGAVNASSVIGKVGAQKGLLRIEELKRKLEEHKDFVAKEI